MGFVADQALEIANLSEEEGNQMVDPKVLTKAINFIIEYYKNNNEPIELKWKKV